MKVRYFVAGCVTRLFGFALFIIGSQGTAVNDMSEIIYLALQNLFGGINPYSVQYELHWGATTFTQPFNYGPVTLLMYLPAMLLPMWVGNWWPGMHLMATIYDFLFCEAIIKIAGKDKDLQRYSKLKLDDNQKQADKRPINKFLFYAGGFLWIFPMGTVYITMFISMPVLLCCLAWCYRDNVKLSAMFIFAACMSYQLCLLILPWYLIYYIKKNLPGDFQWKNIFSDKDVFNNVLRTLVNILIGALPVIIVTLVFLLWDDPMHLINSLFLWSSEKGYVKAPGSEIGGDELYFSIPKLLYEVSGGDIQIGNLARAVAFVILIAVALLYLFTDKMNDHVKAYYQYSILAVALFILTTNIGAIHYIYFMFFPIFVMVQYKKPDFRKEKVAGR